MPDEDIETQPEPEKTPEQTPEETRESEEIDVEAQELWDKALPELKGQYEQLPPDARERLLVQRLAAQPAADAPNSGSSQRETANAGQDAGAPPVEVPPPVDMQALAASLKESFDEDQVNAFVKSVGPALARMDRIGALVVDNLSQQDKTLKGLTDRVDEVWRPGQVRAVLPKVEGAKSSDVAAAVKFLEKGDAGNPEAALGLAVFHRRTAEAKSKGARPASEEAKQKARALKASAAAGETRVPGAQERRLPETDEEMAEFMRQEEEAKAAAKK